MGELVMGEIVLAVIVVGAVLGVVGLLILMSWDLRDEDYASMDRRLERRAARREQRAAARTSSR